MSEHNTKMETLKSNPQQQKMLNELLPVIDKAFKDNFNAYLKMVQGDVSNFVYKKALADGAINSGVGSLTNELNGILAQVGKDIEKQMMSQFKALKDAAK